MKLQKRVRLQEKGWTEPEIRKAEKILDKEEKHDVYLSKIVFWSAIIVIVFANLMVSLILIPFLVVFNDWILYGITALLAVMVGFLYNFLITDIGHLEKKHHILAGILVPIIAAANMVIMVLMSNRFIVNMNINNRTHNPYVLSLVFGTMFILPTIVDKIKTHIQERNLSQQNSSQKRI